MESVQKPNVVEKKEDLYESQKDKDRRNDMFFTILMVIGIIGIVVVIILLALSLSNKSSSVATGPTYSPNPPT